MPLCTPGFVLRTLEAVLSLSAMIVVLSATGQESCQKTTAGPGSDRCYTEMPYTMFGSVVFYVVVSFFTFFWCFLLVLVQVFRKVQQPDWLRRHGETIEYVMDFIFGVLNLVAYILMAIELNQSTADENQGKSPMQMSSESFKFGYGMAIAFITFVVFGCNIAHNLKLSTRSIDPSDTFDGNEKYRTRTFNRREPPPRPDPRPDAPPATSGGFQV